MHESDNLNNDKQKLSQLMDGEWQELNPADCAATLCADEALRAKWSRYHMIRDVIKSEPVQADQTLASRICAAIDDEPSYSNITPFNGGSARAQPVVALPKVTEAVVEAPVQDNTTEHRKPSWFNTGVAGFAVAASVALVTVVGLNLVEQQSQSGASQVATVAELPFVQDQRAVLPVVEYVANTGPFWVSPESSQRVSDEQRLNMMLSQHIENSPTSVREGLLPYSRLVGYEESSQGR